MKTLILNAKHWHIFTLSFGLPFLFFILIIASIESKAISSTYPMSLIISCTIAFFPFIILITGFTLFSWIWLTAIGLQVYLPEDIKLKSGKFKILFILSITYIISLNILSSLSPLRIFYTLSSPFINTEAIFLIMFANVTLLDLAAFLCMLYCLYFIAKTIKTVELKRQVSFSDFAGEFFMIWFYPIGIWIIQPRINKIITNEVVSE